VEVRAMQAEVMEELKDRLMGLLMGTLMGTWVTASLVPRPVWAADRALVRAQRPMRDANLEAKIGARLKEPIRKDMPQT
jgi:hypothetical protein